MLRKILSGIILTLLLVSLFSLAINVKPVRSTRTGTVYIRADGSIDPPDVQFQQLTILLTFSPEICMMRLWLKRVI